MYFSRHINIRIRDEESKLIQLILERNVELSSTSQFIRAATIRFIKQQLKEHQIKLGQFSKEIQEFYCYDVMRKSFDGEKSVFYKKKKSKKLETSKNLETKNLNTT